MSSLHRVCSLLFSWTFLGGLVSGIVMGAGGLYLFAQVYVNFAGGSAPADDPYLRAPPVSVSDSLSTAHSVPLDWSLSPVDGGDATTIGAIADRPVLLTVGASWCEPCTAQLSTLQALHDTIGADAHILFVSDESRDSLRSSIDAQGRSLPVYRTGELPSSLDGDLLPRSYILRANGNVVYRQVGPADWNTRPVRRLLSRLSSSAPS